MGINKKNLQKIMREEERDECQELMGLTS